MFFYAVFAWFTMTVATIIYIMRVNETNSGIFSWSTDPYNNKKTGFDYNYIILFIALVLLAPISLPLFCFWFICKYLANKIYAKVFKPKA